MMKKVYVFYDKQKTSSSMGKGFLDSVASERKDDFEIIFLEYKEEMIMAEAYENFINRDEISIIVLDGRNNVLTKHSVINSMSTEPILLYLIISRIMLGVF